MAKALLPYLLALLFWCAPRYLFKLGCLSYFPTGWIGVRDTDSSFGLAHSRIGWSPSASRRPNLDGAHVILCEPASHRSPSQVARPQGKPLARVGPPGRRTNMGNGQAQQQLCQQKFNANLYSSISVGIIIGLISSFALAFRCWRSVVLCFGSEHSSPIIRPDDTEYVIDKKENKGLVSRNKN